MHILWTVVGRRFRRIVVVCESLASRESWLDERINLDMAAIEAHWNGMTGRVEVRGKLLSYLMRVV